MLRVTIWNEGLHERDDSRIQAIYPHGIHGAIAEGLHTHDRGGEFVTRTATLHDFEHGLTEDVLRDTDVLFWWGHRAHDQVTEAVVERVVRRVHEGMGLVVLHSGHFSKPFKRLLGTPCTLHWREAGERERLWVLNPAHPLAEGLEPCLELPHSEMYGEPFAVPEPDETVLISWFTGGEVFRSGLVWRRGGGRLIYLAPGHESYPIYHDPAIRRLLTNAARYAAPSGHWPSIHKAHKTPPEQARERLG